jgi:hypothetical protein
VVVTEVVVMGVVVTVREERRMTLWWHWSSLV